VVGPRPPTRAPPLGGRGSSRSPPAHRQEVDTIASSETKPINHFSAGNSQEWLGLRARVKQQQNYLKLCVFFKRKNYLTMQTIPNAIVVCNSMAQQCMCMPGIPSNHVPIILVLMLICVCFVCQLNFKSKHCRQNNCKL